MKRQDLKNYYFLPSEIESLELCKVKYAALLGDKAGGLIRTLDRNINNLQRQYEKTGLEISRITDDEIRAIIELRYMQRKDWETVFLNVYAGAYSADPAQYCKRKLDRFLEKEEEQMKKKEIVNVTETFFTDEPAEEEAQESATAPETTPTKARRQVLGIISERKSKRMQLLVRPSTYDALKVMAGARGQSMNDLINSLLENYIDSEERKSRKA